MRATVLDLVRAEPWTAVGVVGSLALLAGVQLGLTWVVRGWIGGPLSTPAASPWPMVAAGATLLLAGAVAVWLSRWLMARFTYHLARRLREEATMLLLRRTMPAAAADSGGDLAARVTGDVEVISHGLASVTQRVVREGLVLVGALVLMLLVAWPLLLAVATCGPLLAWAVARASHAIRRWSVESRAAAGEVGRIVGEQHEGLLTIKTLQTEAYETARVRRAIARATDTAIAAEWHASLVLGVVFAATGAAVLALLAVGSSVADRLVHRIDLVTFVLLLAQIIEPVRRLADVQTELARVEGAWTRWIRLREVAVEAPSMPGATPTPTPPTFAIRARHLIVAQAGRPLLHVPSWDLRAGDHLALVGPSGAGKTTLLTALIGAGDLTHGSLDVCGVRVDASALARLRATTCLVPQTTALFGGTLRDNIAYGTPEASEDDLRRVCAACGLTRLVDSHPARFDQPLLITGRLVSAGERQRIGLARAILREPSLLLLDEATSALDSAQEDATFAALAPWLAERTVILVSHRLSTARRMRDVAVLRDGVLHVGSWRQWPPDDPSLEALFAGQVSPEARAATAVHAS